MPKVLIQIGLERLKIAFPVTWVVIFFAAAESCQEGEWDDGTGKCVQCDLGCSSGTYRDGCGGTEQGQCKPCDNPIPHFSRYIAGGGLQNKCPYVCDFGHYLAGTEDSEEDPMTCKACALDCPLGQYRKGCFGSSSGACVDCSPLKPGAVFTGSGGLSDACPVTCKPGHYSDLALTTCFACNASCPRGKYRSQCMGTSPGFCAPCQKGPKGVVYVDYGDAHGRCPYCANGRHAVGNLGERKCIHCEDCPVGQFKEFCGNLSQGSCSRCSNGPPHSYYTTNGHLSNNCSFECDVDFFKVDGSMGTCQTCASDCHLGFYRDGCGGSDPGQCVTCNVKPPNSHFIADGGLRDSCPWTCDLDFIRHHAHGAPPLSDTCEGCPTNCPVGQYRKGCGLEDLGSCVPCSNAPENSHYTSNGGLRDACGWECDDTFHEHGGHPETPHKDGVTCTKCGQRCPVGQFRTGCHESHPGTCTDCTIPNAAAIFIGDGDLLDTCPWICEVDQYTVDGRCKPCPADCPVGQWRKGCKDVKADHPKPIVDGVTNLGGQALVGTCVACDNGPPSSHYTDSGGLRNSCSWSCDATFFQEGNVCRPCDTSCDVGYYRSDCTPLDPGTCTACTIPNAMAIFTGDGDLLDACSWICRDGYYTANGTCQRCLSDCPVGQWRKGCKDIKSHHPKPIVDGITNAGGKALAGSCVDCGNGPPFSHYTSNGGLQNSCSWGCDEGSFQEGEICRPCNSSCGVGYFRVHCSLFDPGKCVPCTTAPMLSVYTSDGGLKDDCIWRCRAEWPIQGPCIFTFLVNRVFVILMVICCLSGGTICIRFYFKPGQSIKSQKVNAMRRLEQSDFRELTPQNQNYLDAPALNIPGTVLYRPVDRGMEYEPMVLQHSSPRGDARPMPAKYRGQSNVGVFGRVKHTGGAASSSEATAARIGPASATEVAAVEKLPWVKHQQTSQLSRGLGDDASTITQDEHTVL